jgi:integrase/recombinase XerD
MHHTQRIHAGIAGRQELAQAAVLDFDRVLWTDAVTDWLRHIVGNVAPKTAQRYAVSINQAEPYLNAFFLDQITRRALTAMVRDRREKGASNATIKRDLTAILSVLEHAIDNDWIEENPTLLSRRRLKERRDPITLPDVADVERAVAAAPGNMAHLIFAAWKTGCRQNELVMAERRNLDHARRQLTVIGKRNKRRVIGLDRATYERLAAIPPAIGSPVLFYHSGGRAYQAMSSRWRELMLRCAKTGTKTEMPFRRFRFHDLRHLHSVEYLKVGGSLYDLSKRLGHTSVKTTEIYLDFLTGEEAATARAGRTPEQSQHAGNLERF